jgi:hypothetical protein
VLNLDIYSILENSGEKEPSAEAVGMFVKSFEKCFWCEIKWRSVFGRVYI